MSKKTLQALATGLALAVGLSTTAFDAHAIRYDNIDVTVTASTPNLSYGKAGAYTFYIANATNGTINSIRFRATLSAGEFALANPIGGGAPATCTRVTPQSIDCTITGGVVPSGYSTFDFAFTAPSAGASVGLTWDVRFGQGTATNFITSTAGVNPAPISLIQDSTTEAQAYIPPTGDNLYTGTNIPSTSDPFTVGLVIDPAANKVVTGAITEVPACSQPTSRCAKLDVLRKETLTDGSLAFYRAEYIPGSNLSDLDNRLVIVLRLAAFVVAGKNINQAVVYYTADATADNPNPTPVQVLACPKRNPSYTPPASDPPCLASRIEYTKRTAPDPLLIGAWELMLYSAHNGFVTLAD